MYQHGGAPIPGGSVLVEQVAVHQHPAHVAALSPIVFGPEADRRHSAALDEVAFDKAIVGLGEDAARSGVT